MSLGLILTLSSHPRLGLPICLALRFLAKTVYTNLFSPMLSHDPPTFSSMIWRVCSKFGRNILASRHNFIEKCNDPVVHTFLKTTGEATYVQRNTEACLCKHCCSEQAVSTTYSERVFVVFSIRHAMCLRYIVIYGLSGCTIFLHLIS
jgi:hypothetical protein